jgi:hypothetical protein
VKRFDGRRLVVTGGGRGIGRAVVLRLLSEGSQVVAVDGLRETQQAGASLHTLVGDVSSESSVADFMAAACTISAVSTRSSTTPPCCTPPTPTRRHWTSKPDDRRQPDRDVPGDTGGVACADQGLRAVTIQPAGIDTGMPARVGETFPEGANIMLLARNLSLLTKGALVPADRVAGVVAMIASETPYRLWRKGTRVEWTVAGGGRRRRVGACVYCGSGQEGSLRDVIGTEAGTARKALSCKVDEGRHDRVYVGA